MRHAAPLPHRRMRLLVLEGEPEQRVRVREHPDSVSHHARPVFQSPLISPRLFAMQIHAEHFKEAARFHFRLDRRLICIFRRREGQRPGRKREKMALNSLFQIREKVEWTGENVLFSNKAASGGAPCKSRPFCLRGVRLKHSNE